MLPFARKLTYHIHVHECFGLQINKETRCIGEYININEYNMSPEWQLGQLSRDPVTDCPSTRAPSHFRTLFQIILIENEMDVEIQSCLVPVPCCTYPKFIELQHEICTSTHIWLMLNYIYNFESLSDTETSQHCNSQFGKNGISNLFYLHPELEYR